MCYVVSNYANNKLSNCFIAFIYLLYLLIQIIYDAVYSRFSQLSTSSSTFLERLVVLHLAYAELEPQLQQFQQLVSLSPKIVSSVSQKLHEDSDFKNEISVSI